LCQPSPVGGQGFIAGKNFFSEDVKREAGCGRWFRGFELERSKYCFGSRRRRVIVRKAGEFSLPSALKYQFMAGRKDFRRFHLQRDKFGYVEERRY